MFSIAIFFILHFIKTIRMEQNNENPTRLDSDRDDQFLDSFYKDFFKIKNSSKNKDRSHKQKKKRQKKRKNHEPQKNIYNGLKGGLYSTLNYTRHRDRYNSSFDPSRPRNNYNPLLFVHRRGDTAYDSSIRDIINNPRGDLTSRENETYIMQDDDPNVYDAQNRILKYGEANVGEVTQPRGKNNQENMERKPGVGNNVNQPSVENETNENIREHQLNPQVFARILGDKHQADDEKSEHSIAGSYIPIEKLRMRRRLTFTCSRTTPLINIDFV
ncbi:hypothetical protein NBO_10g0099 [Nosema bombycis CQ1]|uniref:Uncharacterized protein n=1 Tax=Nosema bombycis (strain CQ1 / CVCC 102059) TaxID=578461 RepID=R0MAW2_NOSB1|nr:hypothetical protein NBO_10g0099 [Nosema bombycis CQ1]|eukprot:EOB15109.1 hypothetical protein NBO_10g0099 [Nosema bombycis CQ1]